MNNLRSHTIKLLTVLAIVAALCATSLAQMDLGPKVESNYGDGLPRDRDRPIFSDNQYPVWPWAASYRTADGSTVQLTTAFPVADTKDTGGKTPTAEAVWVGVRSGADFLGRDVRGKAVVIYSFFVPGGRSHSASDRAGLFNANTRAVQRLRILSEGRRRERQRVEGRRDAGSGSENETYGASFFV